MLEKYKHIRPVWQFGMKLNDSSVDWKLKLYDDFYFRHHCASVQSAITMIMENMDDRECLQRLMNEIGAHHFFYDACEPHLDIFIDALMTTMKKQLSGANKMDEDAEQSWKLLLKDVKTFMAEGIAYQRNIYLRQCMTPNEMVEIRSKWEKVVEFGLPEAGEILCDKAIQIYSKLIDSHNIPMVVPLQKNNIVFTQFAEQTMKDEDKTRKRRLSSIKVELEVQEDEL
ncbi:unnamed protein product [Strongylus vulgaris]|uniref:Globin domain-containing protein n=1 Tax=Strongylus vulgaris TaxID=40348 RepID=A0A3P7JYV5_STRVU|nr:unnamed protein product [Strongylus vulgaris]